MQKFTIEFGVKVTCVLRPGLPSRRQRKKKYLGRLLLEHIICFHTYHILVSCRVETFFAGQENYIYITNYQSTFADAESL